LPLRSKVICVWSQVYLINAASIRIKNSQLISQTSTVNTSITMGNQDGYFSEFIDISKKEHKQ